METMCPPALPMADSSWQPSSLSLLNVTEFSNPKTSRRLPPNFPASLSILPFTASEWSKAIADVKREYTNRRFRPCIARCNDILNNLRDKIAVEPVYLIYLHFYAASSQESMARILHHASSQRLSLLHQAKEHYEKASQLITTTTDTVNDDKTSKRGSICGDSPSSARTSDMWTSTEASVSSSRATSISSLDDTYVPAKKRKKKRRPSYRSDAPIDPQSIVRPDSPTLGLSPLAGSSFQDLLDAMPSPPPGRPGTGASSETGTQPGPDSDPSCSAPRFSALLADLQNQITRHLSFIDDDLAAARNPPPTATNLGLDDDKRRSMELHARIERLRAGGWQRRRFDASRYEELRESAMADIYS